MAFQGLLVQLHSINLRQRLENKLPTYIDVALCLDERKKTQIVK